ncbi:type II CRISPR RNA-guided endonuclease Cas9 [soil metagenome]
MTTPVSYTLGLDVGIASVGWCVMGPERIIDLGVRCFDKAENEKGESKGIEWRTIKTQRRRIHRRADRLLKLRRLCLANGLVTTTVSTAFCSSGDESPWELRVQALDRLLEPLELARAIYHIVKHRGFLSTRKAELKDDKKEAGRLSAGVSRTKSLVLAGNWRSPGELAARDPNFTEAKRNKQGEYKNTFDRNLLREELQLIFAQQRIFKSTFADSDFESKVIAIFEQQKPALTGAQMLRLVGKCTFEANEYRAPKSSWTAERFVWMTRLNNLRIVENGSRRELTDDERAAIIDLPYEQKEVKYKSVRIRLKKLTGFSDAARFVGLTYGNTEKDPEASSLIGLRGWHTIKATLESAGQGSLWQELSINHDRLDQLVLALTLYKTDDEISSNLKAQGITDEAIEALLDISFTGFIQLSTKALHKIVPYMEAGKRFDEACADAEYHHSKVAKENRQKLLPPIPKEEIRNPVVCRALSQTRKIVNAIVQKFGSPSSVHIELARDLSKPFEERREIKKAQEKFQQAKERSRLDFVEKFGIEPNPRHQDLVKYRLYEDQQGKCAYSLAELDLSRLFEPGYAEIDHILPYSRSFDDSQNNKILVSTSENRNKKNSTPYEYLGGDGNPRWEAFQTWVIGNRAFRAAKRERLLRRSFDEREATEFKERNLTDTRYLAKFLKNFIEGNLALADDKPDKVVCVNGQFTAFLRARWGLIKIRAQSDKHHAMDAAVIAAASRSLIKRVSDFSRIGKIVQRPDGLFVSRDTGEILEGDAASQLGNKFPQPWHEFRDELVARLDENPVEQIKKLNQASYTDEQIRTVHPLFVSRAPKRRNKGAFHQETIRSAKQLDQGISTVRSPLHSLSLSDLEQLSGAEDPRNKPLYDALKLRLEQFKGDGRKAFAEPFYKPNKLGEPSALVRSVKIKRVQKGGLSVRSGIADQASMIRIDVFTKAEKFFAIPIYQSDRASKELPCLAVVSLKPRKDWTVIDDTFTFLFSLHRNDVVSLKKKDKEYFGYFSGLDVSTGAIDILVHDRDKALAKDGVYSSLGLKTADSVEKYHVNPLGQIFKVTQEKRHGLA